MISTRLRRTAPASGVKPVRPVVKALLARRRGLRPLRAMRKLTGKLRDLGALHRLSEAHRGAHRPIRPTTPVLLRSHGPSRTETGSPMKPTHSVLAQSPFAPNTLVSAGTLEVRLAGGPDEIAASQRLRYGVFYEEMSAVPTAAMQAARRDFDALDEHCDHLLVIDHAKPADEAVVGTYRLLRHDVAARAGGFYSSSEFDLSPLSNVAEAERRFLELGRSCVHPDYRTQGTIQLLWRGITIYTARHRLSFMFGCASLPGIDPEPLAVPLSFLHANFLAPEEIRVRALPGRHVPMDRIPADRIDRRAALRSLPPLIKGYLRLGCYIGDGAVIDPQFGTTDVFILLPVGRIGEKYLSHFDRTAAVGDRLSPLRVAGEG